MVFPGQTAHGDDNDSSSSVEYACDREGEHEEGTEVVCLDPETQGTEVVCVNPEAQGTEVVCVEPEADW